LTAQNAALINNCIRRGDDGVDIPHAYINTVREGPLPLYCVYSDPATIVEHIKLMFLAGYAPGDIFILAPSVKSTNDKNPIKRLANSLSANGILVYVPGGDDASVDESIIEGKLVFSSFHQAKGLERKIVMVVGFDAAYNLYYEKSHPEKISNALYVAITRAKERLFLYHGASQAFLGCIDREKLPTYVRVVGREVKPQEDKGDECNNLPPGVIAVTKLLAHVRSDIIDYLMKCIQIEVVRPADDVISIAYKCEQRCVDGGGATNVQTYHEEVSDINGIAIPAYYESMSGGNLALCTIVRDMLRCEQGSKYSAIRRAGIRGCKGYYTDEKILMLAKNMCAKNILELSNVYSAMRSGLHFKVRQIADYSWMDDETLDAAYYRTLDTLGGPGEQMEVPVRYTVGGYTVCGYIDYVDDDRLVEIKCVTELKPEHYLQLALYAYGLKRRQNLIFNIITNELHSVTLGPDAEHMIRLLICSKYHNNYETSDDVFLQSVGVDKVGSSMQDVGVGVGVGVGANVQSLCAECLKKVGL
jgi:hypothetical protein